MARLRRSTRWFRGKKTKRVPTTPGPHYPACAVLRSPCWYVSPLGKRLVLSSPLPKSHDVFVPRTRCSVPLLRNSFIVYETIASRCFLALLGSATREQRERAKGNASQRRLYETGGYPKCKNQNVSEITSSTVSAAFNLAPGEISRSLMHGLPCPFPFSRDAASDSCNSAVSGRTECRTRDRYTALTAAEIERMRNEQGIPLISQIMSSGP